MYVHPQPVCCRHVLGLLNVAVCCLLPVKPIKLESRHIQDAAGIVVCAAHRKLIDIDTMDQCSKHAAISNKTAMSLLWGHATVYMAPCSDPS